MCQLITSWRKNEEIIIIFKNNSLFCNFFSLYPLTNYLTIPIYGSSTSRGLKLMLSSKGKKMKFRNEKGNLIEKDLFLEESSNPEHIIYTLNRKETEGYPSLYEFYMKEEDFTEFEFATKYFESFQHWKCITQRVFMVPHIAQWREELELKIKARNLKSLINKAETDSTVAKFLLGNKWVEDAQSKVPVTNLRGRPSKEEIKSHLYLISAQEKQIDQDLERIKKA